MLSSIPPAALALIAALLLSLWVIFTRMVMRSEKDYVAAGTGMEIFSALAVLAVLAFGLFPQQPNLPQYIPPEGWLIWLAAIALYTAFIFITYKSQQTAEAGERTVVNQLQIPFALLLAFLFLSEPLTANSLLGAALIISGAVICTYRPNGFRWKVEGVRLAAFAALLTGAASLMDKLALTRIPLVLYAIPLYIIPALLGIFWMGKNLVPRLSSAISKNAVPIFLAGFFSVASYLLYLLSLSQLPLSQVIVLFNTNVVLTAILGALILSEKGNWQQKLAGAILAFIGAALVAL